MTAQEQADPTTALAAARQDEHQAYEYMPHVHHFGRVRPDELPVPFYSFTLLRATDADGQEHIFHVPTAALSGWMLVKDEELERPTDYEQMRKDRGWPTPMHMRRVADALDELTPARYGDVLRWFADLADAALATPKSSNAK